MVLKKDFEATFKEGFRLGVRLTRAKLAYERAREAKIIGDDVMSIQHLGYGKDWTDLAKNSGRKFCPPVAHEPNQPLLDLGDIEMLLQQKTAETRK